MSASGNGHTVPQGVQAVWMDSDLAMKRRDDDAPPLTDRFHETAKKLIARYPEGRARSALLPLLYLAQAEHGFVSTNAMREIGDLLGLTHAEVGAVATFYTMFKRDPQGKWLVSVCTQPSCSLSGGADLRDKLEKELGIRCGGTTPDGLVSLEDVECLCACDGAPVFSINYENFERMSVDDAVSLIQSLRAGSAPPPGSRGDVPSDFLSTNRRLSGEQAPR